MTNFCVWYRQTFGFFNTDLAHHDFIYSLFYTGFILLKVWFKQTSLYMYITFYSGFGLNRLHCVCILHFIQGLV